MSQIEEGVYKDRYQEYADEEEACQRENELVEFLEAGQLWSDKDFLPDGSSLYRDPHKPFRGGMPADAVEWNRINSLEVAGCDAPKTFLDGTEPGDVVQGALGNCWFVSALSVLASRQMLLRNVIVSDKNAARGIYTLKFFKGGKWVYVHVDDKLPCNRAGKVLFGHGQDPNEVWVSVIEKAYAKLHGCYENLTTGFIDEGLRDLTGVCCMKIKFNSKGVVKQIQDGSLFQELKEWMAEGSLMGCSRQAGAGAGTEQDTGRGILAGHAYGLLEMVEAHQDATLQADARDVRLVRCRNPWGMGEWKGPWADNAPEWEACPQIKERLVGAEGFRNDGCFWIEWEEFCREYNQVFVCVDFPEGGSGVRYRGQWVPGDGKSGAGGSPKYATFPTNPQYTFSVEEAGTKVVGMVSQKDLRWQVAATEKYTTAIGYVLMKLSGNTSRVKKFTPKQMAGMSRTYSPSRSIAGQATLLPGRYAMIPTTFDNNASAAIDYIMEIYTDKPITLEQEGDAVADLDDLEEEEEEELAAEGKAADAVSEEKAGEGDRAALPPGHMAEDLEAEEDDDDESPDHMALESLQRQVADLAGLVVALQGDIKGLEGTVATLEANRRAKK
uniref:Calpain catalytic domain-containing protein n=1 Tax=Heterosigma akashiwo TaxID=2829 RepID=A0A6S9I198_HETAK|mmetsp:Transcript_13290/g.20766  ORF Transcript_13290/g.20766 Transcript_13290/m.20766 type:complete len:611 (+) Transcript_13290:146-1978(+)